MSPKTIHAACSALVASTKARLYLALLLGATITIGLASVGADTTRVGLAAVLTGLYALWMVGYLYLTDAPSDIGAAPLFDPVAHARHGVLVMIPATWQHAAKYTAAYGTLVAASLFLLQVHPAVNAWPYQADVDFFVFTAVVLLVIAASGVPIELLGIPVVRRWGKSPPPRPLAAWLLGGGITGWFCGNLALALVWTRLQSLSGAEWPVALLDWLPAAVATAYVVTMWIRHGAVSAWQARLEAQTQRAEAAEQGRRLAEAQLAMMQAQIEPHFLYNTLASVQYLVRKDGAAADFLLTQLIRYLRSAMPKLRMPMSTLGQEFELADAYLQIARMRMGGRLTVSVELAEFLHEMPFPPLVLQTLVENALQHGIEPKVGPVSITVRAALCGRQLEVTVEDDGVGLRRVPGPAPTAGSGAGLANIRARLAGIYAGAAQLAVTDRASGGATSTVTLLLSAMAALPAKAPAGAAPPITAAATATEEA